jgi:hypothetical protein
MGWEGRRKFHQNHSDATGEMIDACTSLSIQLRFPPSKTLSTIPPSIVLLHLQHAEPVDDHHRLDHITSQVKVSASLVSACHFRPHPYNQQGRKEDSHPIVLITLRAHIPRPQVLHAPSIHLNTHILLKQHERLIPLCHEELILLLLAARIRREEEPRKERVGLAEVRCGGRGRVEDRVEPVECGLEVEIVPEAVAEDESDGFFGFGWAEGFAELG